MAFVETLRFKVMLYHSPGIEVTVKLPRGLFPEASDSA